jgi:hypothetical protein
MSLEQLIRWCIAEQKKLRWDLQALELAKAARIDGTAHEINRLKAAITNLEAVVKRISTEGAAP